MVMEVTRSFSSSVHSVMLHCHHIPEGAVIVCAVCLFLKCSEFVIDLCSNSLSCFIYFCWEIWLMFNSDISVSGAISWSRISHVCVLWRTK
jgi:hypothetical protein